MSASDALPVDLLGDAPARPYARGYPAAPGSGPEGEQCRGCGHFRRVTHHGRRYSKCGQVRATHGSGTDISMYSPACWRFEHPDASPDPTP